MRLVTGTLRCCSSDWMSLRAYLRSRYDIVYDINARELPLQLYPK